MVELPSRRDVLRAGSAIAATGLAGCTFGNQGTPTGHLLVGNQTTDPVRVSLAVIANPEGERESLVDGLYRVPAGHVLQFEGVLESRTEYSIAADVPGGEPEDQVSVGIETCDENDPAEKMDVRVRAAPDDVGIIPYGCDQTYTRREDMTYVDPEDYLVDAGAG